MTADDISLAAIDHEQYLKPVLDDDAVILGLFDLPEILPPATATATATTTATATAAATAGSGEGGGDAVLVSDLLRRNAELREELAAVAARFDSYRAAVQQTLDQRWGDVVDPEADAAAVRREREREKAGVRKKKRKGGYNDANPNDESKYYWESYAGTGKFCIHTTSRLPSIYFCGVQSSAPPRMLIARTRRDPRDDAQGQGPHRRIP